MARPIDRRRFLSTAVSSGLVGGVASQVSGESPAIQNTNVQEKITLGIMGANNRGTFLARKFAARQDCVIASICDVDERARNKLAAELGKGKAPKPQVCGDFRRLLDDQAIDALVVATPNHWHAPATILACAAGKHVYVEKPCSHNPREGEWMVQAARKHRRVVQMGTQRRSSPFVIEAINKIHAGAIGRVLFVQSWYNSRRKSIGQGQTAPVPQWLDYSLWQGPAPERPYQDNLIPYNWHWFWHWGNGELGNNGVHTLDLCRWGLNVDYPTRVVSLGKKLRYADDQQTPDTHQVTFYFDDQVVTWEGLSWSPFGRLEQAKRYAVGTVFHGEEGTLLLVDDGYQIFDMKNKEQSSRKPSQDMVALHLADFLDSIRADRRPHADIEEGHKSTLLCHLGNIAHRTGRELTIDPKNGHILNDPEAQSLWRREYRPGWEPKV